MLENLKLVAQSKKSEAADVSSGIVIPSPTSDPCRQVEIWIDEIGTPSLGFGSCHCHESPDEEGICNLIALCTAILNDRILLIERLSGDFQGFAGWLDLRDAIDLEEELTNPSFPNHASLRSWSGKADKTIGPEDFDALCV